MVALTMIGSGQDPGAVVFAGIATAAAGVVSSSAGAGLGSKAEQDVRAAGIADKQSQAVDQPLVGQTKLAHILEHEGSDPADAWHQVKQTAPSDLCRALLEKAYGISETAPAASSWRAAAAMGTAFGAALAPIVPLAGGIDPPGGARCRRHRRPGCPGAGQSLDAEAPGRPCASPWKSPPSASNPQPADTASAGC